MSKVPVTLIKNLAKKKLIQEAFAADIIESGDVNKLDSRSKLGVGLLFYVVKKNKLGLLKKLVQHGARLDISDINSNTLLHVAAHFGYVEIVAYLLKVMNDKDIKSTNMDGMSALHIAALAKKHEVVDLLLKNDELKDMKDLYGRTSADLTSTGDALTPQLRDLRQAVINKKLSAYLKLHHRNSDSIIDKEGNCNGWAFLFLIYASANNESEFYDILNTIASWDGSLASMNREDLPTTLKGKYKNLQDLFEQVINDLAFYHHQTEAIEALKLKLDYKARIEQYALTQDKNVGRKLRHLFSFAGQALDRAQLEEMLAFFAQWPGISVDIGGGKHAASLYITKDGQFKYFDPNFKNKVEAFSSAEALADHIFKFKYKALNQIKDNKIEINFDVYKFYNRQEMIPNFEVPTIQRPTLPSANQFSPLHLAIMANNLGEIQNILSKEVRAQFLKKDIYGCTPLMRAFKMKNTHSALMLLEKLKSIGEFKNVSQMIDFDKLEQNEIMFVAHLVLNHPEYINIADVKQKTILMKAIKSKMNPQLILDMIKTSALDLQQVDVDGLSYLMYAIEYQCSDEIKDLLVQHCKNINQMDGDGKTALTYAVRKDIAFEVYQKMLSMKDIDVNLPDINKMTPLMYAFLDNVHKEKIKALIENKTLNINITDGLNQSYLIYAIQYNASFDLISLMLQKDNINVDLANNNGHTALFYAIFRKRFDLVPALLEAGARVDLKDKKGQSLMEYAEKLATPEIQELLKCYLEKQAKGDTRKPSIRFQEASQKNRNAIDSEIVSDPSKSKLNRDSFT